MTSAWSRERPMVSGSASAPIAWPRSPLACVAVIAKRETARARGEHRRQRRLRRAGAGQRSASRRRCEAGADVGRIGAHGDRRVVGAAALRRAPRGRCACPRRRGSAPRRLSSPSPRRAPAAPAAVALDAHAVGRAGVGDAPAVVVEPELGVAPAGVGAVDAEVGALVLADDVAPAGHDRVQHGAARAGAVLDLELAARGRRAASSACRGGARAPARRRRAGGVGLAPAADHAHLVRARDRQRRRRPQRGEQLAVLVVVAGRVAASRGRRGRRTATGRSPRRSAAGRSPRARGSA